MQATLPYFSTAALEPGALTAAGTHAGEARFRRPRQLSAQYREKRDKIVIADCGASGSLPEHTLAAYAGLTYGPGANYIKQGVAMTKEGVPIALHDITLEGTTNAEEIFPRRARSDGHWYAADFTLEEIRRLRVRKRRENRFHRDSSGFTVPTLEAAIQMIQALNRLTGYHVGIYPEIKNPAFHHNEGLPIERVLLTLLHEYNYRGPNANVFVPSFDPDSLKFMRFTLGTRLPLVQLIGSGSAYDWLATDTGLGDIVSYAKGIGPNKRRIEDTQGHSVKNNALLGSAHARGLVVHPYTYCADEVPPAYDSLREELAQFYYFYDVDGVFTDHPDIAVRVTELTDIRDWVEGRCFCGR